MGLFSKPKTVEEVAKAFPQQEQYLKLNLWRGWIRTKDPTYNFNGENSEDQNYLATLIGQVIAYVFADDLDAYDPNLPKEQIGLIKEIQKTIPEDAHEAMMSNKEMRQTVVYTLRMKVMLHSMINGADWVTTTDEGKRVWDILEVYGAEFPEAVTDKMFDKLVRKTVSASVMNEAVWDAKKKDAQKQSK
jgi:hypothetical protein